MPYLVDCHAHLDLIDDVEAALAASRKAGIRRLVAVGIDLPSSRRAVDFSARYEEVFASIGVHPHDASTVDDDAVSELGALAASSEKVVAIGETGLDYYRGRSPRESQKTAFLLQIELARKTGLPLIIHSREASDDMLPLLKKHASGLTVILHCFSLYDQVQECAKRGYYMSVAGNVTFAKATGLREAVGRIPKHLLLTETDSPYLSPVPRRGKANEPANISYIFKEIANLRSAQTEELSKTIHQNFLTAFNLNETV